VYRCVCVVYTGVYQCVCVVGVGPSTLAKYTFKYLYLYLSPFGTNIMYLYVYLSSMKYLYFT